MVMGVNIESVATAAGLKQALEELRSSDGRSYQDLGTASGLSPSTVHAMCSGKTFPRRDTLIAFVRACGETDITPWLRAWRRAKILHLQVENLPAESQLEVKVLDNPPDAVRAVLHLDQEERVICRRVVSKDGEDSYSRSSPSSRNMIQTAYFPIRIAEQMGAKQLLSGESIRQGSHQYLAELGYGTVEYRDRFAIRKAFPEEAAKLGIDVDSLVTYHLRVHFWNQDPLWCSVTIHVGAEIGLGSK